MKHARSIVSALVILIGAAVAILGNFDFSVAYSYGFSVYEFRYEIITVSVFILVSLNFGLIRRYIALLFNRLFVSGYDQRSQAVIFTVSALTAIFIFFIFPMHSTIFNWGKYRAVYLEHEFKEDYSDFLDHAAEQYYLIGNMDRASDLWIEANERREVTSEIIRANIELVSQRQEISKQLSDSALSAQDRLGQFNLISFQLFSQALLFSGDNDVAKVAIERYQNALVRASRSEEPCASDIWFVLGYEGEMQNCLSHMASVDHRIKWQSEDIGQLLEERRQQQLDRPSGSELLVSFRNPEREQVGIVRREEPFFTRYSRRLAAFGFVSQDLYTVVDRSSF